MRITRAGLTVPQNARFVPVDFSTDNLEESLLKSGFDPHVKGMGLGRQFVAFYEQYAKDCGCKSLRMDTSEKNKNARAVYKKLGFTGIGIFPCVFNGIPDTKLVMLEKV